MKQKLEQIKNALHHHRTLVANFGYLSALQAFTLFVPLITLPYLLKVLGTETYGLVVFAQSVIAYFVIIIGFGFNISATKAVSENHENNQKLSEIVSCVFVIKGLLFLLSCVVLFVALFFIPKVESYQPLFYFSMYAGLYEWLFPLWYFRGIQKMKYITVINMISRMLFLGLIFLLVREETDYIKVPIINGIGAIIAGSIALWVVFVSHKVKFKFYSLDTLLFYVKESAPFFWGSLIGKLKIVSNKTLLGIFVGLETVAIFDIADKIRMLVQSFLDIVVVVVFPSVSKTKNSNSVKNSLRIITSVGVFAYAFLVIVMSVFIPKNWPDYQMLVSVFAIVGLVIFIQSSSYMIGVGVMVVNELKKQYTMSLLMPTVSYLLMFAVIYLLDKVSIHSISIILVISMLHELFFRINSCRKNYLLHWIK